MIKFAIYTVELADAIYILHVFQKKSKKGIATPKREIELISRRPKPAAAARVRPAPLTVTTREWCSVEGMRACRGAPSGHLPQRTGTPGTSVGMWLGD